MAQYIMDMGGKRVVVLPLGIDSQFKPNIDTLEIMFKLGLEGKRVILFVGTLYNFSGLDKVIKNFSQVLNEFSEAVLLIVGDGIQRAILDKLIIDFNLRDKVFIMGYQKYETIPEWINLAEVCILPFEICKTTKDIIPTKVLQYLACGKPVVATKLAGLEGCDGILFTDDITEGIIEILRDKSNLGDFGLEYSQKHNYENIVSQLENILKEIR
jgi:glycosyltransferase involved in cell wall biosynthesis